MLETRYDRAAVVIGIMMAVSIYIIVDFEILSRVKNYNSRYTAHSNFIMLVFAVINGAGMWWGIRWIGRGWIPPVVYAIIASFASLIYISQTYAIEWYGKDAFGPFFWYIGSFIGSAAVLYVVAVVVEWIGKGK